MCNVMKSFITISILILIGCSREKPNDKIPSSLFDTLKEQVVFVTDSSFKQSDDYNLNIARLNFLNFNSTIDNKDSFVLRLFIDTYRKSEKEIIEVKGDRTNITVEQILFKEIFDGAKYFRSSKSSKRLTSALDNKTFFQKLLENQLLTLSNNKFDCINNVKDGTTYSIQIINQTGQKFYSYSNPEYADSSCISEKYFNNIISTFKDNLKQ